MTAYTIYTCYNAQSAVLYVGVTSRGDKRITEHARRAAWFKEVALITREYTETADQASERERQLIAEHSPPYNRPAPPHAHIPVAPSWSTSGMTLAQMAAALGLKDPAGLRRLCEAGAIRAEKIGKTWLVQEDEVERYRREHLGKRGRPPKEIA